jgi:hypothetical protein
MRSQRLLSNGLSYATAFVLLAACGDSDQHERTEGPVGNVQSPVFAGVPGDFGMGRGSDIILVPDQNAGWNTIPVAGAFSTSTGNFQVINAPEPLILNPPGPSIHFHDWVEPTAKRVPGDYNGDGQWDVAIVGGPGLLALPIAYSHSNFLDVYWTAGVSWYEGPWADAFHYFVTAPNVILVPGDYDNDGRSDIAIIGGPEWTSIPVARALANGNFFVTNEQAPTFAGPASVMSHTKTKVVSGDFDHDNKWDIVLVGNSIGGANQLTLASSNGNGTFTVTSVSIGATAESWATNARDAVAGDFDGDGWWDIAFTGGYEANGNPWAGPKLLVHLGTSGMNYAAIEPVLTEPAFGGWATWPGAKPLAGNFSGVISDTRSDIALVGSPYFGSIPVVQSNGWCTPSIWCPMTVTNGTASWFPGAESTPGVAVVGAF